MDLENCPGARLEGDNAFGMLTRVVHEAVLEGLPAVPSESAMVAMIWSVAHGLACLLLDGTLANKLHDETRESQIREVMGAFGAMLRASMAHHEPKPHTDMRAAPAKRPRTGARRTAPKRKVRA